MFDSPPDPLAAPPDLALLGRGRVLPLLFAPASCRLCGAEVRVLTLPWRVGEDPVSFDRGGRVGRRYAIVVHACHRHRLGEAAGIDYSDFEDPAEW